jgi:hypothetical protein
MVTPMRAFSGSNIFSHDPGPTRRSRQKTYPIQRLITPHKLVLRKLSQIRPTRRVLPGSSRALLACGMISYGEHSQKGLGSQRTIFLLCFFLFSSGCFSPILFLFCYRPCEFLGARVILSTFCSGWVDFQAPGCSFGVAVSANPTGLTVLSLGDRFVCALGGSDAKQPTTNHISLAVSIYQALSSHGGRVHNSSCATGGN